jgi:hypothetical protein
VIRAIDRKTKDVAAKEKRKKKRKKNFLRLRYTTHKLLALLMLVAFKIPFLG